MIFSFFLLIFHYSDSAVLGKWSCFKLDCSVPSKHGAFTQCCFNVGPEMFIFFLHSLSPWINTGNDFVIDLFVYFFEQYITAMTPIRDVDPMLGWCWTSVEGSGPALNQYWLGMNAQRWTIYGVTNIGSMPLACCTCRPKRFYRHTDKKYFPNAIQQIEHK